MQISKCAASLLPAMTVAIVLFSPMFAFAAEPLAAGENSYPLHSQGEAIVTTQAQQSMPDWKGSLFSKKSSTYNNALALKAAELSENAYGGDGGHESVNIRYMLKHYGDNGIIDFKSYNYAKNYSPSGKVTEGSDSSAFTVGHDKLKVDGSTYTILIVVARGTVSDAERVGDINLFDITHKLNGYEVRKNDYDFYSEINKGVEDYVKNHKAVSSAAKKGKLKVLITGHSLGGAAANLYAAHLDKAASKSGSSWKNHLEKDDIYAYTFGAIKVFMDNSNVEFGYENIHNVYNYYDSFGPHGSKEWLHVSDPKAKFGHTDMFNIGKIEEGSNILDAVHNHDMSRYIEALKAKKISCSGKQQFKVVFKPNKGLGAMPSQIITRNKKTALHAVTYQRVGYSFAGWNMKANGKGESYRNKQQVKNLAKTGKTVTLYAQWKKAATTSYKISTPYYSLTIPKIWRDKVQWKTTVSYVRQCKYENYRMIYSGKKYKFYTTSFYLKGHKGDESYWLARIGAGRNDCENDITGFNTDKTSILVKNNGRHRVYLLAANMPVRIGWHYNIQNDWTRTFIPSSEADQKKMLKLTAGTTAYYNALKKWEARTGDWNDSSLYYNRVNKYLEPKFKNAIKVK